MNPLGIALIGCGTVGGGVAKLLTEQNLRLADKAGRPLHLKRVIVRDADKSRPAAIPTSIISTDVTTVFRDTNIHVGVELMGGLEPARTVILQLLESGKDVVTANKAVLARHGDEIFEAARKYGRSVAFEASVAGGIPIISALTQGLVANQIISIKAILNGTSNFILTQMTEEGQSYADALAEAQRRGYAEADPTLDVNGMDAAHKLALLARITFGVSVPPESIERRGIDNLNSTHFRFADELGYVIKLLAEAWVDEEEARRIAPRTGGSSDDDQAPLPLLALHVEPTLIRKLDPLAQVRGAYNAIHVVGDAVGDTLYYGRGAGEMPTASAVVADIIDLAVGRAQHTFRSLRLWSSRRQVQLRPPERMKSRFYLRIHAADEPGVLAEVAGILARHRISIASLVQHEAQEDHAGGIVPIVIMTHIALISEFHAALTEIDALPSITGPSVYLPVAE